ncbi:hypothetical protein R1flu_008539 [Riccia fluitans]|uniref:Uncharacterized protein n=1 Tax=Riccia fluitans TaxID=41844 RepID=A0ABD1YD07_9MARC
MARMVGYLVDPASSHMLVLSNPLKKMDRDLRDFHRSLLLPPHIALNGEFRQKQMIPISTLLLLLRMDKTKWNFERLPFATYRPSTTTFCYRRSAYSISCPLFGLLLTDD